MTGVLNRLTARTRLTALYGALSLLSSTVLAALIVTMADPGEPFAVSREVVGRKIVVHPGETVPAPRSVYDLVKIRTEARDELWNDMVGAATVSVAAMTVIALGAGWAMAGRVLRPVRAVSATARRLTERHLHERVPVTGPDDEFRELAETFNGLVTRLERAFQAQRLFTANASHELRGPMTTQRVLVDVALDDPRLSPDAAELAGALHDVLRRQERLVNGLFELASSQHGPVRRAPVDLTAVTGAALERWRPAATSGGLRMESRLEQVTVVGDSDLLDILVDNLVRNAVGHNVPGGWLRVRLTSDQAGAVATLTVSNTGPPLAPDRLAELTQAFRRGEQDRTNSVPGAGLGLAIVATVAHAHQGRLRLTARPGGGLTVEIGLPNGRTQC